MEVVSLTSIFKNPMILMALFTLVMVVGMPWLMDNRKSFLECVREADANIM
jgi:hypothetical protein